MVNKDLKGKNPYTSEELAKKWGRGMERYFRYRSTKPIIKTLGLEQMKALKELKVK